MAIPFVFAFDGIPRALNTYAITVGTSSTVALEPLVQGNRIAIVFVNPGTVDVYVAPAHDGNGAVITPTVNGAGTTPIYAGAADSAALFLGNNDGWNCVAASSAVLTVLEYIA